MNLEPQGVMDGEGDAKERGVRGLFKGVSKNLDMTAQDTTTLLKEFPLAGHRGVVGSPVAHRRGRQRGQAKAAAVPVGLVGNRYAVLAEELEADESPVAPLVPDAGRTLDCSSVLGVAEAADVPWCGRCAGALAEFVCSECELRELLGLVREAAHFFTTWPSAKEGRRRLARLKQMMVSAELEDRVCDEGSPTLMATLAEIQLYLLA